MSKLKRLIFITAFILLCVLSSSSESKLTLDAKFHTEETIRAFTLSKKSSRKSWEDPDYYLRLKQNYPHVAGDENKLSITQLNEKGYTFGTYLIEGYVIEKLKCPDCSKKRDCKPCFGKRILVSERKESYGIDALSKEELYIFVEDLSVFRKGKKYSFLIQILDAKTTNQFINNVKLIYFE